MITGEQVKQAMIANNIGRVKIHNCSICGYECSYIRKGDELFYDSGCDCVNYGPQLTKRSFDDAACLIDMQSNEKYKVVLAKLFGIDLTTSAGTQ